MGFSLACITGSHPLFHALPEPLGSSYLRGDMGGLKTDGLRIRRARGLDSDSLERIVCQGRTLVAPDIDLAGFKLQALKAGWVPPSLHLALLSFII